MTEYRYKWVRTSLLGEPDLNNAKRHEAAGWEPVPPGELPVRASDARTHGVLPNMLDPSVSNEQRGLQLYRLTADKAAERDAYYAAVTIKQATAAAEHYLDGSYRTDAMPKFVYQSSPRKGPLLLPESVFIDPVATIAALPEYFTTDEEADLWQCFIEDFARYNPNQHPQINDLRRRMRALPYDETKYPRLVVKRNG